MEKVVCKIIDNDEVISKSFINKEKMLDNMFYYIFELHYIVKFDSIKLNGKIKNLYRVYPSKELNYYYEYSY